MIEFELLFYSSYIHKIKFACSSDWIILLLIFYEINKLTLELLGYNQYQIFTDQCRKY